MSLSWQESIRHLQNAKNEMETGHLWGEPAPKPAFAMRVLLNSGDQKLPVAGELDIKPEAHLGWSLAGPPPRSGQQGTLPGSILVLGGGG